MPITPISVSASFTSSSLNGLMIASIFFMASHLVEDGQHQGRDVAADALEVRENVEVDLGRLDRLREAAAHADPCDASGRLALNLNLKTRTQHHTHPLTSCDR